MTQMLKVDFVSQVTDVIRDLGYKATPKPSRIPNRRLWQDDPISLIRGPKYKPDILVERNGEFVIVEATARFVLLGGVIQARMYADYFDARVILCVPDEEFPKIPRSVKDFANLQNSIRICPLSEVGNALREVLS